MSAVFDSKELGPVARLVMLALADHADDQGRCYPSNARLCERTGLSERAVRQNIRALEQGGFLTVLLGAGQGGANVYFVNPDGAANAPRHEMPPGTTSPTPRHVVPPKGAPDAPKPSRTIKEPSIEAAPRRRRKPEVPLPEGWVPNDRNIADAQDRHFSAQEIDHEADRFRNHHTSKDSRFRDWDAAWRTWLVNARRFAPRGTAPGKGGGMVEAFAAVAAARSGRA